MENIYNAIQNVYNMDKTTWQEVLAELYNLTSNVENKFDLFENKFGLLLGEEVTIELKKMYDDGSLASIINDKVLNNKANQSDLEVERKRIDLLTKVENGEIEGNTELLDIRVGANWVTYETAADSVRQQFNIVTNDLSNIISHIFKGNVSSGYYNKLGELVPSNTNKWYATTKLPINSNNKYSYKGIATPGQDAVNIYWDKNKDFLGFVRFTQTGNEEINIDVFNDAKYISFSLHKDDVNTFDFI